MVREGKEDVNAQKFWQGKTEDGSEGVLLKQNAPRRRDGGVPCVEGAGDDGLGDPDAGKAVSKRVKRSDSEQAVIASLQRRVRYYEGQGEIDDKKH